MRASSPFFALRMVYVIQLQLLLSGDLQAHTSHHDDIQTKIKALQRDRGIKDNGIKKKA